MSIEDDFSKILKSYDNVLAFYNEYKHILSERFSSVSIFLEKKIKGTEKYIKEEKEDTSLYDLLRVCLNIDSYLHTIELIIVNMRREVIVEYVLQKKSRDEHAKYVEFLNEANENMKRYTDTVKKHVDRKILDVDVQSNVDMKKIVQYYGDGKKLVEYTIFEILSVLKLEGDKKQYMEILKDMTINVSIKRKRKEVLPFVNMVYLFYMHISEYNVPKPSSNCIIVNNTMKHATSYIRYDIKKLLYGNYGIRNANEGLKKSMLEDSNTIFSREVKNSTSSPGIEIRGEGKDIYETLDNGVTYDRIRVENEEFKYKHLVNGPKLRTQMYNTYISNILDSMQNVRVKTYPGRDKDISLFITRTGNDNEMIDKIVKQLIEKLNLNNVGKDTMLTLYHIANTILIQYKKKTKEDDSTYVLPHFRILQLR